MSLSDPVIGFVVFGWGGMVLVLLWQSAAELKAIRTILANVANATRDTANEQYLARISRSVDRTEKLLERAIEKQWDVAVKVNTVQYHIRVTPLEQWWS